MNSKGQVAPKLPKRAKIVWYQYHDANRALNYYYEPRSKQTVWEAPLNVTIKDGKTNKTLVRADSKKSLRKEPNAPSVKARSEPLKLQLPTADSSTATTTSTLTPLSTPAVSSPNITTTPTTASNPSSNTTTSTAATTITRTKTTARKRKTWRRALCGEHDGLREYFYVPETGECSWWLPSQSWGYDDVKCYPIKNTRRNHTSPPKASTGGDSRHSKQKTQDLQFMRAFSHPRIPFGSTLSSVDSEITSNSKEEKDEIQKKQEHWVVRLHMASGHMYYVNKATGHVQWTDPFDNSNDVEEEAAQEKQDLQSSVRLLVGMDYVRLKDSENVDGSEGQKKQSVGKSWGIPLRETESSIQSSMIAHQISFDGVRAEAMLHFPEYIDPYYIHRVPTPGVQKIPFQVSDKVRIRVYSPSNEANSHTQFFTIVPSAESTIRDVTQMAISKCASAALRRKSSGGSSSQSTTFEKNVECYVLKAVGEHSYLVHLEYPLIWYQHVQQKLRESDGKLKESAVIELHLVRATTKEMILLKDIRKRERVDVTECTREEAYMVETIANEARTRCWEGGKTESEDRRLTMVVHTVVDKVGLVMARRHARRILKAASKTRSSGETSGETKESGLVNTTVASSTILPRESLEKHSCGLVDWEALTVSSAWINHNEEKNKENNIEEREKFKMIIPFQDPRVHRFERASWMEKMKWPLRIQMLGLRNVSRRWIICSGKEERRLHIVSVDVVVGLYNNGQLLKKGCRTTGHSLSNVTPMVNVHTNKNNVVHWCDSEACVEFHGVQLCEVPRTTRLGFVLRGYTQDGKSENLAAGAVTLLDETGALRQGSMNVHFWRYHQVGRCPMRAGSVIPARPCDSECELTFELDRFPTPVVAAPLCPFDVLIGLNNQTNTTLKEEAKHLPFRSHTNMTGMTETPKEARLDATIKSHKSAVAFQCAQTINKQFTALSFLEKKAKLINILPQPKTLIKEADEVVSAELNWTMKDQEMMEKIARFTPLDDDILMGVIGQAVMNSGTLTPRDFLWRHRYHVASDSRILSKFLKIIDWGNHGQVCEAREVMSRWNVERPEMCLELLGASYSDPIVRAYAVLQLSKMKDSDLAGYLLQLVQCLKTEPYDDSPLLRFMLRRSLRNPMVVGHKLFWLLRSELHNRETLGRYGLLLEMYVANCGPHRGPLKGIHHTVHSLERVTSNIVNLGKKEKKDRNNIAREQLSQISWPASFGTCLTSLHMCSGIILGKCKVMDSKQAPLWIEFQNIDPQGSNIKVMFKVGDDLRQDQMTLQFLDILDRKSLATGMDLCFRPYRCAGTGHEVGMVEMVPNSDTIARMQWAGGGPYDKKPLFDFVLANAKMKETAVLDALRAFTRSCGGYVVATYVMGIGDRHPSNIMMQEDGHLFHIDFGHFLGNFKQKKIAGIKIDRERAPLVFTPQMLHVLNPTGDKLSGKEVDAFLGVCYATYSLLRERASEFIALFTLMVTAGLPELKVCLLFFPSVTFFLQYSNYVFVLVDADTNNVTSFLSYFLIFLV